MSNSLRSHELQHARLPCPSPSPRICSNSCPLSHWCDPTISSSVVPFSCLQSFPASGAHPMSWLFTSGGQSTGDSASALPINIQGWVPLGLTGLISLLSKGLSGVYSCVYICMYVCIFIHIYVCTHVYTHIHTCVLYLYFCLYLATTNQTTSK